MARKGKSVRCAVLGCGAPARLRIGKMKYCERCASSAWRYHVVNARKMFEAGASLASQHERINRLRPKALSARERVLHES
jgi:hypothetical protein